ncbi:MAG: DNA topoisomerase 4 subunit A [Chloroflexi bacterium]|nr:DNA topoisomerase 4 subunit A [Chloroflexota bacterium]
MSKQEIVPINIEQEMQQSYLDYAMSVIISRAIPDARDGLKPVQRRILYAMYDMGIRPDSDYKKSARIVGEVLGKYHPHGDSAVYDAMARLAQDFSIRYPLVDGQGNFGSIDGDSPAAMRYTEAKLEAASMELLRNIDRDTVNFTRNFDDTLSEPEVLPGALPNLLANGSSGIAVGMSTNIPPHNLGELIDGIIYILQHWDNYEDISVDDLMQFVKGPDFPTGGIIVIEDGRNELATAYATGRGKLMVRGRVHLEDMGRGRNRIIITEIPFQINKNALIEKIANQTRANVLENIADLRDESDRQGMRIVIELNKTDDPEAVIRKLYKHTPLQMTFGVIMLALVDNQPKVMSLKQILKVYIDHQLDVIRRKTEFELNKAEARAHILRGLRIALKNLDKIIAIIRNSNTEAEAREEMIRKFKLDEIQAQAILDMPLKRLTHLEQDKILAELTALEASIQEMKILLNSPVLIREQLIEEQIALKKTYADKRRTQIVMLEEGVSSKEVLTTNAMVPADDVLVGMTAEGKIGRCSPEKLSEKGFEIPRWIIKTNTQETVYFVDSSGRAFGIYVETLPTVEDFSAGIDTNMIAKRDADERIEAIFSVSSKTKENPDASVITFTTAGMVKRSSISDLPFASSQSFVLCKINQDDKLAGVLVSDDPKQEMMLFTDDSQAIRFDLSDVRVMGLAAAGVNGIKLKDNASVTAAILVTEKDDVCIATSDWGLGRIPVSEFPKQSRYGQGVRSVRVGADERVVGAVRLGSEKSILLIRYGKFKTRQARSAVVKPVKRARLLEYTIKLINQTVTGIESLQLETKVERDSSEKGTKYLPPEPEKKKRTRKSSKGTAETPPTENGQGQYNLF